jgi:hypothetical protein
MNVLAASFEQTGVRFVVTSDGAPVSADGWALREDLKTTGGQSGRVGVLTRLASEGRATVASDECAIDVPAAEVAAFPASLLASLDLPPAAPYTVQLTKQGLITDSGFTVDARLIAPGGRPLLGANRSGVLLTVGTRRYTLLDPVFATLQAVDALRGATTEDERFAALGLLQECLPPDALADPYLTHIRVVRADTFTLRLERAADGSVQFDPLPLRQPNPDPAEAEEAEPRESRQVLPEARQQDWASHFRKVSVRSKLPAGQGWYVTVSPGLRKALEVVKAKQAAPAAERAAFARNPRAVLRAQLIDEGQQDDEALVQEVEALFAELGAYGERVKEVGAWQPKVLPITRGPQQAWLPDEDMGLQVGDTFMSVPPSRAPELLAALEEARTAGRPSITFDGHDIPVSDQAITAARALVAHHARGDAKDPGGPAPATNERLVALVQDNLEDAQFSRKPREGRGSAGDLPKLLKSTFYDFQFDGFRWLQDLWCKGAPGGILADDMGLGKTLQTLAFLAWVKEHREGPHKPTLIVGPTGLLRNWRAEHEIHLEAPGLGHGIEAHGDQLARLRRPGGGRAGELASGLPSLDLEVLKSADWVLTTYENLRDYQHSFAQIAWGVVVYDEAQRIKNPLAMTTQAAQAVEAEFSLAVTGTPVENELKDLWSIADTVQPGTLGGLKQFSDRFEKGGADSAERLVELRRIVQEDNPPPMMMRRLKKDHLRGLPAIEVHVEQMVMPPLQAERYNLVVAEARASGQMNDAKMLKALQGMRAVSLHPLREQAVMPDDEFIAASARLSHTVQVLDRIRDLGEKALVFVESLDMQAALVEILQRRYRLPSPPPVINGGVAGHKRKDRVDEFQRRRGFDVMLLSPRAGGVGLTIVEANHVIHLSRWWNPAVEDQATDRVYRIGQQRQVHVYLPLAIHPKLGDKSFDAGLHALLERKRALSRGVLAPPIATDNDLKGLFEASVGADHSA